MSGTTIFTESFETDGNGSRYTTTVPEFSDGGSDFFIRTDGTNISSDYVVTNSDGNFYFAVMDTDADSPQQDVISVLWEDIDITNFTNLTFAGLFAEDDDGLAQDWDADSLVFIEYQIDETGFNKLLQFAAEPQTNAEPGIDSDFDGQRDGAALSSVFTSFQAGINETGSSLDLKLTITNLDANDEDIAFDQFIITGDSIIAGNNGSIGDVIWNDSNGNGVLDGDETGINGVTIDLISDTNSNGIVDNGESVLQSATTSGNGDFNFTILSAGDYIVDVTDTQAILTDFKLTGGSAPLAINLSTDEDFNDADFGYQNITASITATVANASEPNTNGQFTVTLSASSDTATTISYAISGTATDGTDYTTLPGTVTLPANTTSTTIDLIVVDDNEIETDETVTLTLESLISGADNISIDVSPATLTIANDDVSNNIVIPVTLGDSLNLDDFGGVGSSDNPSQEIRDDADMLVFSGTGLTAPNLLLTQEGSDLLVSFDVTNSPGVSLPNFSLENLDNLTLNDGVLANMQFDGQSAPSDDYDVIAADETPIEAARDNITTFLNDLDNEFAGLSNSDDVINAQGGNDFVFSRSGDDILRGGDGDDILFSGKGDDILFGDNGNDSLIGRDDDDTLYGGDGRDALSSSRGEDTLFGGNGDDTLGGGFDADTLTGGGGSDTFTYLILPQSTLAAFDVVTDLVIGNGDEADVLNAPEAVSASNLIQAGTVTDLSEAGIQAVLNNTNFVSNGAATFTFQSRTFVVLNDTVAGYQPTTDGLVEITGYSGNLGGLAIAGKLSQSTLLGTSGDDLIQSPGANNALTGEAGNDTLRGFDGSDTLFGGDGNDTLIGSRGFDLLMGGAGNDILGGGFDADTLTGGSGSDTFRYLVASQSRLGDLDVITDLTIGTDIIDGVNTLSAAEVVQAGNVATLDVAGIQTVLTAGSFAANGAATFSFGSRDFLALNDTVAGYQQATDGLVEITGYTGDLANLAIA